MKNTMATRPARGGASHASRLSTSATIRIYAGSAFRLVIGGAHLLRVADRTEGDALELGRVGPVPFGVVDPQARGLVHHDARHLFVKLGPLGLIGRAQRLVQQLVDLRVFV